MSAEVAGPGVSSTFTCPMVDMSSIGMTTSISSALRIPESTILTGRFTPGPSAAVVSADLSTVLEAGHDGDAGGASGEDLVLAYGYDDDEQEEEEEDDEEEDDDHDSARAAAAAAQ